MGLSLPREPRRKLTGGSTLSNSRRHQENMVAGVARIAEQVSPITSKEGIVKGVSDGSARVQIIGSTSYKTAFVGANLKLSVGDNVILLFLPNRAQPIVIANYSDNRGSQAIAAATPPATVTGLDVPQNVTGHSWGNLAGVTWTYPSGYGASFDVEYGIGGSYSGISTVTVRVKGSVFILQDLVDHQYWFRVRTIINLDEQSGWSPWVTASTAQPAHGDLTGLDADDHPQYLNEGRGDARYLWRENADAFTPTGDYQPATKKYVDDNAGGVSDHGDLTGLGDDDHPQYFDETRGDARYSQLGHTHVPGDIVGSIDAYTLQGFYPSDFAASIHDHDGGDIVSGTIDIARIPVGSIDHGSITGLGDDDHTQYHNDSRGDARYLYVANTTPFTPSADYHPATKKYVDDSVNAYAATAASTYAPLSHTHAASAIVSGTIDIARIPVGSIDHGSITGLGDDDHTQYHNDSRGDARYLYVGNTTAFTPTANYHPATKKYVDDGLATKANTSHTHAGTDVNSGVVGLTYGGTGQNLASAGGTGFVLKMDGSHIITAAALLDTEIPNLNASKITAGTLALARGGGNADFSATGGTGQYVKQASAGGNFTVGTIPSADIATALTTPGPIGGTTSNSGTFTALTMTSTGTFSGNATFSGGFALLRTAATNWTQTQINNATSAYQRVSQKARGTGVGAEADVQANDFLLADFGAGWETNAYGAAARFAMLAAENWASGAHGTYMNWATTATGTTTLAVKMTLLGNGNLGINDGSPAEKLTVGGNIKTTGAIQMFNMTAPSGITGAGQIFANSSEVKVIDAAGNVTTISPHMPLLFSAEGRLSDYVHKEYNINTGLYIEVDLLGMAMALQLLTNKQFIYTEDLNTTTKASLRENKAHVNDSKPPKEPKHDPKQ